MKVTRYKAINKGYLVGSFDVEIPEWKFIIRDLKLFQKDGHRWVNLPSREYEDSGEKKYFAYNKFTDKDTNDRFGHACKEAIDKYCAENAPSEDYQGEF